MPRFITEAHLFLCDLICFIWGVKLKHGGFCDGQFDHELPVPSKKYVLTMLAHLECRDFLWCIRTSRVLFLRPILCILSVTFPFLMLPFKKSLFCLFLPIQTLLILWELFVTPEKINKHTWLFWFFIYLLTSSCVKKPSSTWECQRLFRHLLFVCFLFGVTVTISPKERKLNWHDEYVLLPDICIVHLKPLNSRPPLCVWADNATAVITRAAEGDVQTTGGDPHETTTPAQHWTGTGLASLFVVVVVAQVELWVTC